MVDSSQAWDHHAENERIRSMKAADPIEQAIVAAEQAPPPRLVVVAIDGDKFTTTCQGVEQIAAPILLRLAAKQIESQLGL